LENVLDWGIEVILWFQQFSPVLDWPFKSLTFLGDLEFFLILMPFIYWCLDRRTGVRLLILFLVSAYLNSIAKVLLNQPRPFQYDPRVKPLVPAEGGGLPSGHTQGAVVVWGYLASQSSRPARWVFAGILMIGIPLSRLYLGVHFPTDLIGGYILGALLLMMYLKLASKAETWLVQKGIFWQLMIAMVLPIFFILLCPRDALTSLNASSILFGFAPGVVIERRWIKFCAAGSLARRSLRLVVGLVILFGIWMGLRIAFAGCEPAAVYRVVRYALVGLWGGLGAPWLFVRLKLAETEV